MKKFKDVFFIIEKEQSRTFSKAHIAKTFNIAGSNSSCCKLLAGVTEREKQQMVEKRSFQQISDEINEPYKNFILDHINDHCLRIAVMQGEYRWHYHTHTDELFIVLEGELKIEIADAATVFLKPGEFMKIPACVIHKTSTAGRTVNLTFEKTGDDTIFVD